LGLAERNAMALACVNARPSPDSGRTLYVPLGPLLLGAELYRRHHHHQDHHQYQTPPIHAMTGLTHTPEPSLALETTGTDRAHLPCPTTFKSLSTALVQCRRRRRRRRRQGHRERERLCWSSSTAKGQTPWIDHRRSCKALAHVEGDHYCS
jgi:hypothetical protein